MVEFRGHPFYSCRNCGNPLALRKSLISKHFWAKSGQAYMFSHVTNIIVGQMEDKQLISGLFTIGGIYCSKCGEELGWKYLHAYEDRQKYKEGKFVMEISKIAKEYQ
ncbi:Yippee domain-containing protein [Cephalotus follicularis]|uniref:Protein yippee-like n=1 Tax=Cephalotus follicularis TaxID=3775 RepID=A0A1Q3CRM2_CEPFO|nr:Yippee domain-containing protein [Cephalotus follicularis]